MSDEQIQPCVMCNALHQQMLMLACIHDPCINCAATHFCQTDPNGKVYPCTKCGEVTELDSSSITELQRVYALINGPNRKKFDYKRQSSNSTNKNFSSGKKTDAYAYHNYPVQAKTSLTHQYQPSMSFTQQQHQASMSGPMSVQKRAIPIICPQHSDEELSYYCFTCKKPICPECAIHGSHREHQVQTARKAIKHIKETLLKLNQNITQQVSQDNNKREGLKKNIKDLSQATSFEKRHIQQQFNKLRVILAQKQKQFYRFVDSNYDQNSLSIKNSINSLDKNIDGLVNSRKAIQNLVKRDDLTILAEFAQKQAQVKAIIDESSMKKSQRYEQRSADLQQLNQEIQQLVSSTKSIMLTNK